jgi:hypothetical protein
MKTYGLAAVAAMALAAWTAVGTASAEPTELCSGETTLSAGTESEVSLEANTSALMTTTDGKTVINEQEPKSFLCPDTTKLVMTIVVTSPGGLSIGS